MRQEQNEYFKYEPQLEVVIDDSLTDFFVKMKIITTFGEISHDFCCSLSKQSKLHENLEKYYYDLIIKLVNEHQRRGGKFIGENGCKEWFENNGKTIVILEPKCCFYHKGKC